VHEFDKNLSPRRVVFNGGARGCRAIEYYMKKTSSETDYKTNRLTYAWSKRCL